MIWRLVKLASDRAGAAVIEFGLVAPIFCLLMVGAAYFGLAVFQYASLTEGIRSGARQLAISVNDSTPYSDAVTAIETAAPFLVASSLSVTISVNGTACTSDAACSSLMASGISASVTGTYPCTLVVMGYDFLPNCRLSSTATEMTE
jgi:Flp pilus assembly protein TadG